MGSSDMDGRPEKFEKVHWHMDANIVLFFNDEPPARDTSGDPFSLWAWHLNHA
jgi:hypothetical protein